MCSCEYGDPYPDGHQDEYAYQDEYGDPYPNEHQYEYADQDEYGISDADPYCDVDPYQYRHPNVNSLSDPHQTSDTANLCMGEFCKNLK